jgi:hypothetical protein
MKRTWIRMLGASAAVLIAVLLSSCNFTNYVDEGSAGSPKPISTATSYSGTVLASDSSYYSVTVTPFSSYTVLLEDKEYNANLEVYSAASFVTSTLLRSGPTASTNPDTVTVATTGGTLYIKVSSLGSDLTFKLSVTAGSAANAGGATSAAPVLIGSKPVTDYAAKANGAHAYYMVTVTPGVPTTITMDSLSADLDLWVWTDSTFSTTPFGTGIGGPGWSDNGGTTADSVTGTPGSSTLYVEIGFQSDISACLLTVN